MPHCTKCGANVADNAAFCPSCGAPQGGGIASSPAVSTQTGLSENIAGMLCYLFGWVTGLIFYFTDKRPYVRFHAAQSIVVFGALHDYHAYPRDDVCYGWLMGVGRGFRAGLLLHLLHLGTFILWILLMVKAYQGERFRVPIAADLADKIFGKS